MGQGRKQAGAEKPKPKTIALRQSQAEKLRDAEYAYALIVELMNEAENSNAFRRACARDVMERVWGKPKEIIKQDVTATITDGSQLTDDERAHRLAAILDKARARAGGRAHRGTKAGGRKK